MVFTRERERNFRQVGMKQTKNDENKDGGRKAEKYREKARS